MRDTTGTLAKAAVTAVLLWAAAPAAQAQEQPPALVQVDAVTHSRQTQTSLALGRVVANRGGFVAARVEGPVTAIDIMVGDRIAAGDELIRIDTERFEADMALARATISEVRSALATSEAELRLAIIDRDRLEPLRTSGATSRAAFENAEQNVQINIARVSQARSAIERARAQSIQAELNLKYAVVSAPYDGVVVEKLVDVGDYVNAGENLVRLVSDTDVEVEADVSSDRIHQLVPGVEVAARFDGDRKISLEVRTVIPEENPLTRTRPVRLRFTGRTPETNMAIGESVSLEIPLADPEPVVTVHKDAIIRNGDNAMVYVVADDKAVIRPVRLGQSFGNRMEVLDGLAEGDLAVVLGNERLRPDQPVTIAGPPE